MILWVAITPGGGGGGGYFHMYAYWVCATRENPIFSPEFHSGVYHFHKLPKNLFRSITILNFLADFAVPETIIFKMSWISTRSSPPTAGSARMQSVRQRRGLAAGQSASQTRPGSSRDSHFHAQNGSSSFRSPAFSSSKRLNLVPEPCIFTLDWELVLEPGPIFHFAAAHTYQNLGWVPPPPPPPPPPRAITASNPHCYQKQKTQQQKMVPDNLFLAMGLNKLKTILCTQYT